MRSRALVCLTGIIIPGSPLPGLGACTSTGGHGVTAAAGGGGEEVRGGVRARIAMCGAGAAGAANAADCGRHYEVREACMLQAP